MFSNIVNRLRSVCCDSDKKSNHIACLVKGRTKIVNSSTNVYERQYVHRLCTTSLHAEINCVKSNPKKNKKNLAMLILRFRKDGHLCDSRPCFDCKKYLITKGFSYVFCSVSDGTIQKLFLKDVPNYLSVSQIQAKIIGLSPLKETHIRDLGDMGLDINGLHKLELRRQLEIINCLRKRRKE